MVKLSDFVASFLAQNLVKNVFGVSGGASLHLIDSINKNKKIEFITMHSEQSAAMAADGFSRSSNMIGVALATSGPGATNLITGICCSYYDSVPVLFLTGQVSTFRQVGITNVRQIGFQETPIVPMVRPITKYCVELSDPKMIRYELEKAMWIAKIGRPGPVLIDIPDNLQRELIDESTLKSFDGPENNTCTSTGIKKREKEELLSTILSAERPVIVAGWGLHVSQTERQFITFTEALNIPVVLTWGASCVLPNDHKLRVGTFGTHGNRGANFVVQNSDLVIALGSRLDTKATGSPVHTFARDAYKVMVDIDKSELEKFEDFDLKLDLIINDDLASFFTAFELTELKSFHKEYESWFAYIQSCKKLDKHDVIEPKNIEHELDPYQFFDCFSSSLKPGNRVFVDTGCAIAWAMQAGKYPSGVRVFHDFNNTAMGWSLPASFGSYFSSPEDTHYCVIGDGSMMFAFHELATIKHFNFPLKIFLINNSGYSMIKQTQEQWFNSNHFASSTADLSFPCFKALSAAFGFKYYRIQNFKKLNIALANMRELDGPEIYDIVVSPDARVVPQVKFGRPNEDMDPLLQRKNFFKNMIIPPLPVSKEK